MQKQKFQKNKYYHIYNRGIDKRDIFCDKYDYIRFIRSLREFNSVQLIGSLYEKSWHEKKLSFQLETEFLVKPLVTIICYRLNKNHFHILVKQENEKGIQKFMHRLSLGYAKYFNHKYSRTGSLFSGHYKSVEINSDSQIYYLSAYINGNSEIHKISKAKNWPWSSCMDYLGIRNGTLCDKDIIIKNFKNKEGYKQYLSTVIQDSIKNKKDRKIFTLE